MLLYQMLFKTKHSMDSTYWGEGVVISLLMAAADLGNGREIINPRFCRSADACIHSSDIQHHQRRSEYPLHVRAVKASDSESNIP